MTTFDEMTAHLENLQRASRNLMHAVVDDGCDCGTTSVIKHSGKSDWRATMARDAQFDDGEHRYWGLHNPHTVWGFDVTLAVAVLSGTPHAFDAIEADEALVKHHAWPHMPLAEVAMGEEVRLAAEIEQFESALHTLLAAHVSGRIEYGFEQEHPLHTRPEATHLRKLLSTTEYSYGM